MKYVVLKKPGNYPELVEVDQNFVPEEYIKEVFNLGENEQYVHLRDAYDTKNWFSVIFKESVDDEENNRKKYSMAINVHGNIYRGPCIICDYKPDSEHYEPLDEEKAKVVFKQIYQMNLQAN